MGASLRPGVRENKMPNSLSHGRRRASTALVAFAVLVGACSAEESLGISPDGQLALGTWGGDSAGVIVSDSSTHAHIGCTYGDLGTRLAVDAGGRFTATGTYLLRAFPVAIGPLLPAVFSGRVQGSAMTLTVVVNDTVQKKTVSLGPVTVRLNQPPALRNCPICSIPGRGGAMSARYRTDMLGAFRRMIVFLATTTSSSAAAALEARTARW